jgi:hypothetical protein
MNTTKKTFEKQFIGTIILSVGPDEFEKFTFVNKKNRRSFIFRRTGTVKKLKNSNQK